MALTSAAFAVLVVVIFADVVWRWTTGSGIFWAREVGVFANIVLTIIGIGIASSDGTHLRPRFFDRVFPGALGWRADADPGAADGPRFRGTGLGRGGRRAGDAWRSRIAPSCCAGWSGRCRLVLPVAFTLGAVRHGIFALVPALRPAERGEAELVDLEAAAK